MIVELPGFQDLIHDSQTTFKILLDALSRPGTIKQVTAQLTPPPGLNIACAAACLTLLDLETKVWLQPGLDKETNDWLLFHTGYCFTENIQQADFAVVWDLDNMPDLSQFKQGTPVYPENSTALLIQVETFHETSLQQKQPTLTGAGVNRQITMPIDLPDTFWQRWQQNHNSYPLGVDIYFFSDNKVVGLPRTSKIA